MKRGHGAAAHWAQGACFLPAWYFPPQLFFFNSLFFFLHSPKGCAAVGGAGKLSAGRYQQHDSPPGPRRLPQPDGCPPRHRSEVLFVDPHSLAWPRCFPLSLPSSPQHPSPGAWGAAAQPPAPAWPQAWGQQPGFPWDGWGPACVRLGRSLPAAALQGLGVPAGGPRLLPVGKQLLELLLWGGRRAPGRKSRTSGKAVPRVPLHPSGTLQERRAPSSRKSRVLCPKISCDVSNPLLFTIRK